MEKSSGGFGAVAVNHPVVELIGICKRQNQTHSGLVQNSSMGTILFQSFAMMRYNDNFGVFKTALYGMSVALLKTDIPYGEALINQINIKMDGKAQSKRKACAHSGRIGPHRLVKISAKFRKILDKAQDCSTIRTINTTSKAKVFLTSKGSVGSAQAQRPRDTAISIHAPLGGLLCAGDNSEKSGFTGAV
jgi:hypothetical protein